MGLPSMHKALASILSTAKQTDNSKEATKHNNTSKNQTHKAVAMLFGIDLKDVLDSS